MPAQWFASESAYTVQLSMLKWCDRTYASLGRVYLGRYAVKTMYRIKCPSKLTTYILYTGGSSVRLMSMRPLVLMTFLPAMCQGGGIIKNIDGRMRDLDKADYSTGKGVVDSVEKKGCDVCRKEV